MNSSSLMALQFASGSLAACSAVTITNPFDMLKTRRQLHHELSGKTLNYPSIRMQEVWRREGFRGLQKGLLPAYFYQILMNGTRFMIYEPLRLVLVKKISSEMLSNGIAGAMAGGMGALIGSPFNLIKTRLQSFSPHFSTGHQYGYSGVLQALSSILSKEGVRGLYRGVSASVLRTSMGSAAQLASYEWSKSLIDSYHVIPSSSPLLHLSSAMVSGVVACLVMNPFDVIMTRLYNQDQAGKRLYRGLADCAVRTVKVDGWWSLGRGLVPHFVRVGPHTVLTLVLLEQYRSFLRPSFL